MSIETFDWQGYMSDIGYAPEEIPNEINDEDREWLYGLWARDLMEQLNYEAKQNPFLATSKEKAADARRQFLEYAPDLAHFFGEEVQPNNPDATFDPEEFRKHVVNNEVQNANLGYYLDTFAASRINDDTDVKWPWLKGLTKDQFKKSFMEQQDIDEAWTSVDDIRNGNFGTLAANYQAQLAQQQGFRGDEKSGHMAALKKGWYEFEKLFGYTAGTLGDATGIQWLSDIGNEIAQNVIQKSDAYNYQSKYNQSLADTIKNEGVMAAGGKILNMAEENWATTAAPLALAAIGKILSTYAHVPQPLADAATRAVAANVVRRQGANLLRRASQLAYGSSAALSGLEIGGVRAELEEEGKYDPDNVADVVAAGLVSSSLDFIGNVAAMKGLTITAGRLWRSNLATMEARARLAKEIAEDQAKSFTRRVLSAMATEGVTEGLQEIPAMVVGARRGIEYTPKEVRDRIIDAAAVGAFMGGGIRTGEIMLEKYHRGDTEDTPTPTDTDTDEASETPDVPETPQGTPESQPEGIDGEVSSITDYRETRDGYAAFDGFDVGYGATRKEAAENLIKEANKGRVNIDENDIRSVTFGTENWSVVRYGDRNQNVLRVKGQDHDQYIRDIIRLHNDDKNTVNLRGSNTFDTANLSRDTLRETLAAAKVKVTPEMNIAAVRENTIDIPVNFSARPRENGPGSYAAFNLDDVTRDDLKSKGFRVLRNPRSENNGRDQRMVLYRNGVIYNVSLSNGETDQSVTARVTAKTLYQAYDDTRKGNKKKDKRKSNLRFDGEIATQNLRIRRENLDGSFTVVPGKTFNFDSVTVTPVIRPEALEIQRKTDTEGNRIFSLDPRQVLKKRIESLGGKVDIVDERGITYTTPSEGVTRLDLSADGRVLVSRDGKYIGDYVFDGTDIGEGVERAIFQQTQIEASELYRIVDIPESTRFEGNVLFVYLGDGNTPKGLREYYAIKGDGSVAYLGKGDDTFVERLLALPYIQNLDGARRVFADQFIEFYALPKFYEETGQFIGFETDDNLLPVLNLEDEGLRHFGNVEVDELISAGYNRDFVKVYAIIAPNGEIVRATTQEGIDTFIEDIKDYANILDRSEWERPTDSVIFPGELGRYRADDLYTVMYDDNLFDNLSTDNDFEEDTKKIQDATGRIIFDMKRTIYALERIGTLDRARIDSIKTLIDNIGTEPFTFPELDQLTAPIYDAKTSYPSERLNVIARRRFYRMRTAQAMLLIDMYRNKLQGFVNNEELAKITDRISDYNITLTTDEVRRNTIQAESLAVRLEEAYVDFMRSSQPTQTTDVFWEAIYPSSTGYNYGSFVNRIHSEGTDFRFSRAAETPRVRRRDSILNELQKELGDFTLNEMLEKGLRGESGGLMILPDQEAAHEIERRFTTDATQPYYDDEGLIQGFVAPDGMIYLVEDGIVDGKARQIILHEYGVHARKFGMTDAQFQEIVQNIKAKRDEKSLEGDFVRHAITRAKQANKNMSEDNPIFWEEVAAYAVEDGYHLADTGIVGRMQTWMKNWLWRFGVIDASAFHYQDFVNMAQGMLGNPGPLSFFDGTHDYTKYQDTWKNIPKFSRTILAEDTPDREEFAQRTYRRLRGLDDAIERERNGEDADSIEQATDWRRNDNGNWEYDQLNLSVPRISEETGITIVSDIAPEKPLPEGLKQFGNYNQFLYSIAWHATPNHVEEFADYLRYLGTGEGAQVHGIGIYAMLGDSEKRRLENWKRYGGRKYITKYPFGYNDPAVLELRGKVRDEVSFQVIERSNQKRNGTEIIKVKFPGHGEFYLQYLDKGHYLYAKEIEYVNGEPTMRWVGKDLNDVFYDDSIIYDFLSVSLENYKIVHYFSDRYDNTQGIIIKLLNHVLENEKFAYRSDDAILNGLGFTLKDINDLIENQDLGQQYKLDVPDVNNTMLQEWKMMEEQPDNIISNLKLMLDNLYGSGRITDDYYNRYLNLDRESTKGTEARNYYKILAEALYFGKYGTLQGSMSGRNRTEATTMATQALREAGVKGIHYFGNTDGECAVIFDGSDVEVLQTYFPPRKGINPETGEPFRYSRATAEELEPYSSFINTLENDLVSQRISGVPNEGDTVLYQRGDVNEFITRDSLYTVEDAADYYPDLEQRWIDYHRDDSESNFIRYSRSIPETNLVQRFTSQRTSLPQNDPALYKNKWFLKELKEGSENFDIGAGITTKPTERLASLGVRNVPFDPFNREQSENAQAIQEIVNGKRYPTVTVANVLNVIAEPESRSNVILQAAKALDENGKAFFDVYVAPREGETSIGTYQTAMKPEEYVPEIQRWFNDVERHGSVIIASSPKEEVRNTEAVWWDANPRFQGNIIRYSRSMRPYDRNENRAELRRAINELEQVSLPETIVFEPEEDDREWVDYGAYTNRYYDDYNEEWIDESYDLRFYAPTESTIPELLRESFGVRFVRDVEEADLIQAQYEKAMSRQSDYIGNLWRHLLSRNGILYENDGSYLAGRALGNAFMISHFAPKNLKDGARMMKEIANGHMGVIAAVPPYQGSMLEKVGFRMIGQIPQIFRGELVLKNVYVNRAISNQDIQYAYDEYADGMTPEQLNALIENAKIISGRRESGDSPVRFSRAATTSTSEDSLPQTPKQRGTAIPNAPGVYRMADGSLHIEPSELPVGFESETILYAAISVSDPAKDEPKIAELRGLIAVDEDLMRETDRMMRERNDTNEDHRLGYAVSLILEAYDPTSDTYQQTVDAFHEAVSKATGGAYQNLVLDTGQIEAAAHAAAGIPYEALLTAPQETVPTPRPDTADVQRQQLEEAFANSDAQREYMQVGEDGRPFIATDDSDVDVVFESKVTNPFTTGELADKVLVETTEHNESDDFYNHLADSPHHGTQEPLDTGRFTAQADTMRNEVEAFLASVLPEHIWNRMQILWEDNAENRKLLGNALGNFNIKAWQNKNILVRGWDRSFGQVVRTAAREASRFGWGLWQNRDFRKALTDFYDMYTARIHEELRPYYNQMGVTDPTKLTNGQKIFMVQTFFSKLNQSLFTDDATNMADILGIDAQEYKRVLANVRRGISAQENDLSPFMQGVAGDPELAKQFAREMLRMTMETATNVGTHFVYERANTLGGKDRIHVYTNEWGTWRNTKSKTRFGEVAQQIKKNLAWWQWRYKGSPRAERFARWMMRNAPVWMEYPFKWMHLYVPSARLGDTTLGRASQMISRVWQRIGDMSGTTIQQDYALMEDIHGILRDYGYDPLVANDMFDQTGRRITYEQFFRGLGITSAKAMEKARLADEVVRTAEQLRKEQAANIRSIIVETGVSLYNRMVNAGVPERNIKAMVNNFETKRQRYHDNYSHRMYEAFTPEGKSELSRMLHYLKRDPATGELTIAKRARQAEEKIRQAEARYGRGTSQFYKETVEARKDLRRYERLTHLQNFAKAVVRDKKRLFGAEFNEAVVAEMKNTINAIVLDAQSIGRVDTQAVPHYNSIAAQKARKLDPSKAHHRELMAFLSEIKDPMRIAVYSADQQRQIIAKLQFNKELGEYLVDNNMASVRGVPNTESIARDLAQMESGTFLEYINVDPEFMPEIKAEWENMQKVTETVLGGLTDAVKANSTVYSLRLAMNNYIGNASMLLASGHFWRFGNWMEAGGIVRKQFLDRFTYGAKDPSDFGKMIIKEMEDAMVSGGSGTEMSVFQLNKGAHENFVQMMTELLYGKNLITRAGKFKADNFVKRALEYARKFYTYGDEWVKPLMYINNRMNAIAKYKAIEKRQNGETEEEYNERVLKKAIEEASEMTIRETVSWENSPFFVRQLSTKSVRFFVPDFLLHNFQMLRITASNYVRLWELGRELANFNPAEMNPDKVEEYRSALKKEFAQRSVGGAMTAGVYAGLAGATGSCMAFIPYMMNTLMAAIDGEDDKDKDNTFFNPQQWEGAQRILNYKTGGDNFFVPAWMHDGKIYAWNYGRASVMLTHAIPQPATENPEFTDYAAQFFKNIVNIGGGTIAQEIVNNFQGKDKWGRDIGIEAGWGRIFDRVIVPGAVRQLLDMSIGYPGSSDNPYREGKAIKMSDAVGITVNAYDMRDIVNELGWDMGRVGSNSQNVVRKSFVKRLTQSDALSDSDVASMVSDMREDNARHMDRANYLLTGLRQMGMENKDIQHWLTTSRKDANTILSKKQATAFLKGHNVYDDALVTYLKNRRNNLAKGKDDVRMSGEELATVLQNYDKAIRIYSQALRTN